MRIGLRLSGNTGCIMMGRIYHTVTAGNNKEKSFHNKAGV
jgi:hypothetical protein